MSRLLVVSPVRDENAHIERVVRAMAGQTRPPALWLVVDDGSTDGTLETLRRLATEVTFMRVMERPPASGEGDRLAAALEARAFNSALEQLDWRSFDFVGKLDGDIELGPDHFERLLEAMDADPSLGICGATLVEPQPGGEWARVRIPSHHVHGAVKLYRRRCFEEIGGVHERLGWDTIDETYARMAGYDSRTLPDAIARHWRPSATAQGALRGRARHGECAWIVHYGPLWVALRSLKVGTHRPRILSGAAFLWGYASAALRGIPRVDDPRFRRFTRAELRARMLVPLHARGDDESSTPDRALTLQWTSPTPCDSSGTCASSSRSPRWWRWPARRSPRSTSASCRRR